MNLTLMFRERTSFDRSIICLDLQQPIQCATWSTLNQVQISSLLWIRKHFEGSYDFLELLWISALILAKTFCIWRACHAAMCAMSGLIAEKEFQLRIWMCLQGSLPVGRTDFQIACCSCNAQNIVMTHQLITSKVQKKSCQPEKYVLKKTNLNQSIDFMWTYVRSGRRGKDSKADIFVLLLFIQFLANHRLLLAPNPHDWPGVLQVTTSFATRNLIRCCLRFGGFVFCRFGGFVFCPIKGTGQCQSPTTSNTGCLMGLSHSPDWNHAQWQAQSKMLETKQGTKMQDLHMHHAC